MDGNLTRRGLIRAGGGAAGLALLGQAGCDSDDGQAKPAAVVRKTAPANAMNVVVVVIDSLRTDHIYGRRARTETFDALAGDGLRFTRAYPGGHAHHPRAPLDHGGPPRLPVPRLAAVQGPARAAGLGADRPRAQDLDGVPPGAGLDHRVRDRQPAHRVVGARQVPQAPRPRRARVRPGAVRAQGHAPGLEGRSSTSTCRRRSAARAPSRGCSSTCAPTRPVATRRSTTRRGCSSRASSGSSGRAPASRSRSWSTPSTPTSRGTRRST